MSNESDVPSGSEVGDAVPESESGVVPAAASATAGAESTGWPGAAKGTAAVLAIVAVAALIAAIVGFSQASSSDDDASAAESDLAAAEQRAEAAEQERDDLAAQVSDLESVGDDLTDAQDEIDTVTAERDEAVAENEQLTTDLEAANADLASIKEDVEAFNETFPIGLDSSLIPDDMPGNYDITFQEAYCEGLATCGVVPTPPAARVYFTDEQFLRIGVPGILDAGLFALEGSLYGITDSFTALPACGGAERRARVTITMYADNVSIDADLNRVVNDVNASITIDAPANGPDCPSVLVFYASNMVPVG